MRETVSGTHPAGPVPDGRVALITGAAGVGIGQAIARRLLGAGYAVAVTDRHAERTATVVSRLAEEFPGRPVRGWTLDVGVPDHIRSTVADVEQSWGPVRLLVNNAPHNTRSSIFETADADWERTLSVNLTGPWQLVRAVAPGMTAAGGGVIVNISSYAPDVGIEGAYAIAKGGLNALTRVCAREGGPRGIRCVTVSTGFIAETKWARDHPEMAHTVHTEGVLGSHPTPAEVADAVEFLSSERAAHITGETLTISSGAYLRA
jgi:NAD(P)-dependent dehydrogenase (short-subunit alcohol dehydrogenase family)